MFSAKTHILIVDDDSRIRDLLHRALSKAGYVTAMAPDAAAAQEVLDVCAFDLIILDVMMPGTTGVEWTRHLREQGRDIPIILLTAMGEVQDRITGLEAEADDYITKPFEMRELILRIEAIVRRRLAQQKAQMTAFTLGPWRVDLDREYMTHQETDEKVDLSAADIKLLRALSKSVGAAVSRYDLAIACGVNPDERTIDVQITRLRRRLLDDPKNPLYIETLRGQGYQLRPDHFRPGV